jgi:acetylornithine deacetylase/succinyl-diaminopimelate desuccinylase-like protein
MNLVIGKTLGVLLLGALITPSLLDAQEAGGARFQPSLASQSQVQEGLRWIERNFPQQVEEWIRITEIPAPSMQEQARGAYLAAQMEREGLEVSIDALGNIIGRRPGVGGGPTLVFAAHIDTVHPLDVDVSVIRDGDVLRAPGVFDNSASVANMLAVIRALNRAGLRTEGDLIFIGTSQEELGLKGMIHWLDENPGVPDMLIAMDGGLGAISYGALGIYWTRFAFLGDGAHTNQSTGRPHPVRALSEAVARIYELEVPEGQGGAVFNVGMLEGGSVFNAIPERASFTMDLRSVNPALLDSLQAEIESRVAAAAALHGVQWVAESVNRMPAGGTEADLADRRAHPLVTTAEAVYGFLGLGNRAVASGSTDANAGVVRGIPSIAVGRSLGGDQHTLSEWADIPSALPATQAIFLLALSLAGLAP